MSQIRVGVIRGGPSSEYEVSLKTGGTVLAHLPPQYHKEDILITKDGVWHFRGEPITPQNLPNHLDVAFLCLHGEYGEDGQVQRILDEIGLPYTGSGSLASALGMNKLHAKNYLLPQGIKMPRHIHISSEDNPIDKAHEVFLKFAPPYIVKPTDRGSSVGLFLVKNVQDLPKAIEACQQYSGSVLVEEFIRGKEASCGVVENLRGQKIYSLMPVEIRPPKERGIFDYDAKYSGLSQEICPGRFAPEENHEIRRLASLAHQHLGLKHYSRSDFIVSPRGVYYLETNTLPGLTTESLLPKELVAAGIAYSDFLDHLIRLALDKA
jgi:D-alanine-D-alanine ligase